jgi:hypothetical protein
VAYELGRVRKLGTGDRNLEKDVERRGKSRGGRAVFIVVREKQQGDHALAFPN